MELAQQICEYSSELSGARAPHDVQRVALNLTRAAHNDTTVLRHASALFRSRLVKLITRPAARLVRRVADFHLRVAAGDATRRQRCARHRDVYVGSAIAHGYCQGQKERSGTD